MACVISVIGCACCEIDVVEDLLRSPEVIDRSNARRKELLRKISATTTSIESVEDRRDIRPQGMFDPHKKNDPSKVAALLLWMSSHV
jgi:hypothetical protein